MTDTDKALETVRIACEYAETGRNMPAYPPGNTSLAALDTIEAELARLRGLLDEASETIRSLSGDAFRLREECDRDHMPPAVAARLRAERDEAVAALRFMVKQVAEVDRASVIRESRIYAEALRKIADYGRGRGMDGCHEEKLRDIARAALAPKEPTDD